MSGSVVVFYTQKIPLGYFQGYFIFNEHYFFTRSRVRQAH